MVASKHPSMHTATSYWFPFLFCERYFLGKWHTVSLFTVLSPSWWSDTLCCTKCFTNKPWTKSILNFMLSPSILHFSYVTRELWTVALNSILNNFTYSFLSFPPGISRPHVLLIMTHTSGFCFSFHAFLSRPEPYDKVNMKAHTHIHTHTHTHTSTHPPTHTCILSFIHQSNHSFILQIC